MPLTIWNFVLSYNNYVSEKQLTLPRNNRFPGSNILLPTFLTGGKLGFQVANLLLLIWNPEY